MENLSDADAEKESGQEEDKMAESAEKAEEAEEMKDLEVSENEEVVAETTESQEEEEMSKKEEKNNSEEVINSSMENEEIVNEETTVITKGTTINGGIKSDTSLIVKGVIEGDVECLGKLTITGRVAGNSTASEIYVNTPKLQGNLVSRGSVKVDVGTVVIGSISSASVVVAGAVKGDIDVNGPVIVDSTAVVQGSILGKSIQINSGAVIDGMCSLKYADVDLEALFE